MTLKELAIITAIICTAGIVTYRVRVWYNRRWIRHFRKYKMFRNMPPGFNDPRSARTHYPQDHP